MAEGVHGVVLEQVMISQRVVLTFLPGAGQRCGSRINIKTQGTVHLSLMAVAMEPSTVGNGLQVVTLQEAMVSKPTTPPAMPNTINNSTPNSKLVPRHSSSRFLMVTLISLSTVFPTLPPDGPGHSSPTSV